MSEDLRNKAKITVENFIDQLCSCHYTPESNYMEIYTIVFEYCTKTRPFKAETKDVVPHWMSRYEHLHIQGSELYYHIKSCLEKKLNDIQRNADQMSDDDVFRLYVQHWNSYKNMCDFLFGATQYLHRHWLAREWDTGRRDIYDIRVLSKRIWENVFFKAIFPTVTQRCLNLIRMNRNNHSSFPTDEIKNILQLYLDQNHIEKIRELMNDDTTMPPINDLYIAYFEVPFLQELRSFYSEQECPSFEVDRMLEYLTSVSKHFDYEINLAQHYLPKKTSTIEKTIEILEEKFLPIDTFNIISEQLQSLILDENNYQKLKTLYDRIRQIPKLKNELLRLIENYICDVGINTIERVSGTAINDPKLYIETVIDIHKKFSKFVQDAFGNEQSCIATLDKACGHFINNNKITQTAGSTTKSAELLARHCDVLLRKGSKAIEGNDLEEKFNQIMIIFDYIEDKDVFEKLYRNRLAKRLVDQLSASDDYEESMISKLEQACGFEYTSKLQRMFQDIGVSKTLILEYEKYCEQQQQLNNTVDFTVMVLSSKSWPFSASPTFVLPTELKSTFDSFTNFYTHRHNGRKLTWFHQDSRGELQTFFTSQKYILQVSTYQMVVLLLFNKAITWTVERLQDETQIKVELLLQILLGLMKSKLLVCTDMDADEVDDDLNDSDIKTTYSIRLATDFKSKKLRINLNVPLKSIEQKDIEGVHRTIDEDRKMVIHTAIVRIMKARQTLKHALLMQEVIQQLSSPFRPKIVDIKKCIDILVEKEYLQRDTNEKDVLCYIN